MRKRAIKQATKRDTKRAIKQAIKWVVKYAHILFIAVLGLVLLCNLWLWVKRVYFHQELPDIFGYSQLTVLSGSMEPTFSTGDLLIIRREKAYQIGDMITFWDEGGLTTHRIIDEGEEGFITKGDYNPVRDSRPVPVDQVAGRVVLVIPSMGRILLFLKTPPGMLLFLTLGLLILLLPDLWDGIRQKRKRCGK